METGQKSTIINATVILSAAAILQTILHQSAHFFAAKVVGAKSIDFYHNAVSYSTDGLSDKNLVFMAAAGPLVSLLTGLLFHFLITEKMTRKLGFLFMLYLSAFGYIGFFGSLIAIPVSTFGDLGFVASTMEFPLFIQIGISVVGLLLLYMIIRNLMQYFVDMGTKETTVSRRKRARLIRSLLLYPSLFGAAILMIQSIPFHLLTSFFIPILSPFALLLAYR
jgi:hypothetical protein